MRKTSSSSVSPCIVQPTTCVDPGGSRGARTTGSECRVCVGVQVSKPMQGSVGSVYATPLPLVMLFV